MDTDDLKHQHCTTDGKHSPECVMEQVEVRPKATADEATLSEARELKRALLTEMFPPTITQAAAKAVEHSPLPWEAFPEKVIVAEPERARVVIRAANTHRVVVEDNPERWEQALSDFALIVSAVNNHALLVEALRELVTADVGGEASPDFYRAVDKARHALATVAQESGR